MSTRVRIYDQNSEDPVGTDIVCCIIPALEVFIGFVDVPTVRSSLRKVRERISQDLDPDDLPLQFNLGLDENTNISFVEEPSTPVPADVTVQPSASIEIQVLLNARLSHKYLAINKPLQQAFCVSDSCTFAQLRHAVAVCFGLPAGAITLADLYDMKWPDESGQAQTVNIKSMCLSAAPRAALDVSLALASEAVTSQRCPEFQALFDINTCPPAVCSSLLGDCLIVRAVLTSQKRRHNTQYPAADRAMARRVASAACYGSPSPDPDDACSPEAIATPVTAVRGPLWPGAQWAHLEWAVDLPGTASLGLVASAPSPRSAGPLSSTASRPGGAAHPVGGTTCTRQLHRRDPPSRLHMPPSPLPSSSDHVDEQFSPQLEGKPSEELAPSAEASGGRGVDMRSLMMLRFARSRIGAQVILAEGLSMRVAAHAEAALHTQVAADRLRARRLLQIQRHGDIWDEAIGVSGAGRDRGAGHVGTGHESKLDDGGSDGDSDGEHGPQSDARHALSLGFEAAMERAAQMPMMCEESTALGTVAQSLPWSWLAVVNQSPEAAIDVLYFFTVLLTEQDGIYRLRRRAFRQFLLAALKHRMQTTNPALFDSLKQNPTLRADVDILFQASLPQQQGGQSGTEAALTRTSFTTALVRSADLLVRYVPSLAQHQTTSRRFAVLLQDWLLPYAARCACMLDDIAGRPQMVLGAGSPPSDDAYGTPADGGGYFVSADAIVRTAPGPVDWVVAHRVELEAELGEFMAPLLDLFDVYATGRRDPVVDSSPSHDHVPAISDAPSAMVMPEAQITPEGMAAVHGSGSPPDADHNTTSIRDRIADIAKAASPRSTLRRSRSNPPGRGRNHGASPGKSTRAQSVSRGEVRSGVTRRRALLATAAMTADDFKRLCTDLLNHADVTGAGSACTAVHGRTCYMAVALATLVGTSDERVLAKGIESGVWKDWALGVEHFPLALLLVTALTAPPHLKLDMLAVNQLLLRRVRGGLQPARINHIVNTHRADCVAPSLVSKRSATVYHRGKPATGRGFVVGTEHSLRQAAARFHSAYHAAFGDQVTHDTFDTQIRPRSDGAGAGMDVADTALTQQQGGFGKTNRQTRSSHRLLARAASSHTAMAHVASASGSATGARGEDGGKSLTRREVFQRSLQLGRDICLAALHPGYLQRQQGISQSIYRRRKSHPGRPAAAHMQHLLADHPSTGPSDTVALAPFDETQLPGAAQSSRTPSPELQPTGDLAPSLSPTTRYIKEAPGSPLLVHRALRKHFARASRSADSSPVPQRHPSPAAAATTVADRLMESALGSTYGSSGTDSSPNKGSSGPDSAHASEPPTTRSVGRWSLYAQPTAARRSNRALLSSRSAAVTRFTYSPPKAAVGGTEGRAGDNERPRSLSSASQGGSARDAAPQDVAAALLTAQETLARAHQADMPAIGFDPLQARRELLNELQRRRHHAAVVPHRSASQDHSVLSSTPRNGWTGDPVPTAPPSTKNATAGPSSSPRANPSPQQTAPELTGPEAEVRRLSSRLSRQLSVRSQQSQDRHPNLGAQRSLASQRSLGRVDMNQGTRSLQRRGSWDPKALRAIDTGSLSRELLRLAGTDTDPPSKSVAFASTSSPSARRMVDAVTEQASGSPTRQQHPPRPPSPLPSSRNHDLAHPSASPSHEPDKAQSDAATLEAAQEDAHPPRSEGMIASDAISEVSEQPPSEQSPTHQAHADRPTGESQARPASVPPSSASVTDNDDALQTPLSARSPTPVLPVLGTMSAAGSHANSPSRSARQLGHPSTEQSLLDGQGSQDDEDASLPGMMDEGSERSEEDSQGDELTAEAWQSAERVVEHQVNVDGEVVYRVLWTGMWPHQPEWVTSELLLEHAPELVDRYEADNAAEATDQAGEYERSMAPEDAAARFHRSQSRPSSPTILSRRSSASGPTEHLTPRTADEAVSEGGVSGGQAPHDSQPETVEGDAPSAGGAPEDDGRSVAPSWDETMTADLLLGEGALRQRLQRAVEPATEEALAAIQSSHNRSPSTRQLSTLDLERAIMQHDQEMGAAGGGQQSVSLFRELLADDEAMRDGFERFVLQHCGSQRADVGCVYIMLDLEKQWRQAVTEQAQLVAAGRRERRGPTAEAAGADSYDNLDDLENLDDMDDLHDSDEEAGGDAVDRAQSRRDIRVKSFTQVVHPMAAIAEQFFSDTTNTPVSVSAGLAAALHDRTQLVLSRFPYHRPVRPTILYQAIKSQLCASVIATILPRFVKSAEFHQASTVTRQARRRSSGKDDPDADSVATAPTPRSAREPAATATASASAGGSKLPAVNDVTDPVGEGTPEADQTARMGSAPAVADGAAQSKPAASGRHDSTGGPPDAAASSPDTIQEPPRKPKGWRRFFVCCASSGPAQPKR